MDLDKDSNSMTQTQTTQPNKRRKTRRTVSLHLALLVGSFLCIGFFHLARSFNALSALFATLDPREEITVDLKGKTELVVDRRAVFSKLGQALPLSFTEFQSRRNSTNIHIVISHCKSKVDWIPSYMGNGYNVTKFTILTKCGQEIRGLKELKKVAQTEVIKLKNVGRCDHSFAYWIKNNYGEIEESVDMKGDDVILFLKDNSRVKHKFVRFVEFFIVLTDVGFGCVKSPMCCKSRLSKCKKRTLEAKMLHNKTDVLQFHLDHYQRIKRDKNHEFLNKKYPNLDSWKKDMNITLPTSSSIPVCYGGMFGAKRKQILNQPLSVWKSITKSLERGDNIIEGHYAERMWAGMLTDHKEVNNEVVDAIITPASWHTQRGKCSMRGMYYTSPKSKKMAEQITNYIARHDET